VIAPIEFLSLTRELHAKIEGVSFDPLVVANVTASPDPVYRQTNAMLVNSIEPSKARAVLSSLPGQQEENVERVSFNAPALAPMAFARFCIRYSKDCAVHELGFRLGPVELTSA
jgi:hypothetical protein